MEPIKLKAAFFRYFDLFQKSGKGLFREAPSKGGEAEQEMAGRQEKTGNFYQAFSKLGVTHKPT